MVSPVRTIAPSTWFRFADAVSGSSSPQPHHSAHLGNYTSSDFESLHRSLLPLVVAEGPHVAPESRCVGVSPIRLPLDADGIRLKVKAIAYRSYDFSFIPYYGRCPPLEAVISIFYLLFSCFVDFFTYEPGPTGMRPPSLCPSCLSPNVGTIMELHFGLDLVADCFTLHTHTFDASYHDRTLPSMFSLYSL